MSESRTYMTSEQLKNLKGDSPEEELLKESKAAEIAKNGTKALSAEEIRRIREELHAQKDIAQTVKETKARAKVNEILIRGKGVASGEKSPQRENLEKSPWDSEVKALLQSLPPINENLDLETMQADLATLPKVLTTINEVTARGAESVLFKATRGNTIVCVKAIRNWLNSLIGNPRTRSERPLLQNVNYQTKCRHLKNEFEVSQKLQDGFVYDGAPVNIYILRQRKKWGMELGYDMVEEYINGFNFSSKQIVRAMTFADKVRTCYWMSKALSHLHNRGIVHLDIKPSNFMIDVSGKVRIIDFGVSVPAQTVSHAITGTMGYLSPEQIGRTEITEQTDIFALGVVFAVLFGGKPLNQSMEECSKKRAKRDALMSLEKGVGPEITDIPELHDYQALADVIRRCTIPVRKMRIPNCQSLMVEFRQFAENNGIAIDWQDN